MHRLRLLYAVPTRGGYPRDIPLLQCDVLRRKKSGRRDYLQCTAFRKNPASASQCVGCGKCEQHCPQHIEIRGELKAAAGELETVKYKFMKTAIGVLKLW